MIRNIESYPTNKAIASGDFNKCARLEPEALKLISPRSASVGSREVFRMTLDHRLLFFEISAL